MAQVLSLKNLALLIISVVSIGSLISGIVNFQSYATEKAGSEAMPMDAKVIPSDITLEKATFGGGCFWCTEAVYQELQGVYKVVSGYSGGKTKDPTYKEICTGTTGHAEVVQIEFDPQQVSFEQLLEVFWKTHDPTTLNRQGADVGTQYRSVVFYHNTNQQQVAEELKKKLDASGAFAKSIVTEISPIQEFYPAEDYHQDYFALNSSQPYCQAVIAPKVSKFREVFGTKLKSAEKKVKADGGEKGVSVDWSKIDWKSKLTPEQYRITRQEGTERAFENEYWDNKKTGVYHCVCCDLPLFDSSTKYKSGSGWPSFYQPIDSSRVINKEDRSLWAVRTENRCARCDAHLMHT